MPKEDGTTKATGELVAVKTVDKTYEDADGNIEHEDFIKLRVLFKFDRDVLAELGDLVADHKTCSVSVKSLGQMSFLDVLAGTKAQASRERAREMANA